MTPKALRSIRLALGLSLDEFSARLKIKRDDLDAWEFGASPIDHDRLTKRFARLGLILPDEWPLKTTRKHC